jgi:WD40 repeat protein
LLKNGNLAAGLANSNIIIYNPSSGSSVTTLRGHTSQINDLILIGSENLLVSSSSDNSIRLWNMNTNAVKYTLTGHSNQIYGLKQVSSTLFASASSDKTIRLWNILSGTFNRTLVNHTGEILLSLDMLYTDEKTLISGSQDQTLMVWDTQTGNCVNTLNTNLIVTSMVVIDTTEAPSKRYVFKSQNNFL